MDEDQYDEGITVTRIKITNESGSKALESLLNIHHDRSHDLVDGDEERKAIAARALSKRTVKVDRVSLQLKSISNRFRQ